MNERFHRNREEVKGIIKTIETFRINEKKAKEIFESGMKKMEECLEIIENIEGKAEDV